MRNETFGLSLLPLLAALAMLVALASPSSVEIVYEYVKNHANDTFRSPSGYLKYSYLVPSGFYQQLWDWDSMFTGIALLPFGGSPYLVGSMMNFLDHTNLTNGEVQGCLTPSGTTQTIYHAKPIIIQGAYLASKYQSNDFQQFKQFKPQMEALLNYWERTRKQKETGLYVCPFRHP